MSTWRNSPTRWGTIARFLHWTIGILILMVFGVGLVMEDIPSGPDKFFVYAMHKSIGLLVLALILTRILWRLVDKAPAEVPGIPALQHLAAKGVHLGLYALMLAVPVTGWLVHSYSGYATRWFGQESLPILPVLTAPMEDREVRHDMGELHEAVAFILIALVAVHVGAALYHHFFLKNATLSRMTPGVKEPRQ